MLSTYENILYVWDNAYNNFKVSSINFGFKIEKYLGKIKISTTSLYEK